MTIHSEGSTIKDSGHKIVFVDKVTGVHYLWFHSGYAGGLTPLLDKDGKPVAAKPGEDA